MSNSTHGNGAATGGAHISVGLSAELDEAKRALVLADIEARLTKEVRGLVASLAQFGNRAQLIREELPADAQFCKLVTGSLALVSLQMAYSFGKDLDKPIFFDDGRQYLAGLSLSLEQFIREVELDGRRFMAIALIEQGLPKAESAAEAGEQ